VVGFDSSVGVSLKLTNHSNSGVGAVTGWIELEAALIGSEGFVVASEGEKGRERKTRRGVSGLFLREFSRLEDRSELT